MQSKSRLGPTLAGCAVAGVMALAAWADSEQNDHGDTWSTASLLTVGTPQWGQIEDASDADLFRFDLPGLTTIEVSTSGQTDTRGELLDSSGARLATDDDSGAGANFQIDAVLEPGGVLRAGTRIARRIRHPYPSGRPARPWRHRRRIDLAEAAQRRGSGRGAAHSPARGPQAASILPPWTPTCSASTCRTPPK